ncbi:hypothetical protein EK21DRAFT_74405 [Setomelanomma holmii]|uniref:LysM domain-containing protein n=1 Tax=Setomelanomma holmii TaxID=210430 RepID=A0A9P4H2F1_9PLEO|nr:hypothetical protein EK21DRAFT_74405 [Setomelanomma holmii]
MNPAIEASLSTSKSNSTLRPRTRRLISVEDDIYYAEASDDAASRTGSRVTSRNGSPTPNAQPGVAPKSRLNVTSEPSSSFVRSVSAQTPKRSPNSNTFSGLFGNSWSAIQGIAANVIGNEGGRTDPASPRRRRPASGRRTSVSAPPPKQWGPAGTSSHVGAGTHEARENKVRAMKRKDLLNATEHLVPDSVGRIKRRNSDERLSASAPPGENDDRDALVYVHKVRPQDTLAGLSIKFNCDQATLRKSNRMWPNDSVQTKQMVVLPVDACGVKGRPAHGPDALPEEDLLLGEYGDASNRSTPKPNTNGLPNGWSTPRQKDVETNSVVSSSAESETPWIHDSWSTRLLPSCPAEVPRILGRIDSTAICRSTSLVHVHVHEPSHKFALTARSTARPQQPLSRIKPRPSTEYIRKWMGTAWARWCRNTRQKRPAQDGLNKKFAQYLPNMAPPPGQEYFTPWAPSLLEADAGVSHQYGGSGAVTPLNGTGVDLQEIGGAIEGWVRKVGSQAQKILTEPGTPGQGKRSAVPVLGAVGGDLGDLIELRDDAFEIGDDERERGRSRTEDLLSSIDPRSSSMGQQFQTSRPDINLVLTNRRKRGDSSKKD